jgi:hypothetical protein
VAEDASEQGKAGSGMSPRAVAWLAWSLCALCLSLVAFALVLLVLGWSTPLPKGWSPWHDQAISLVGVIGAPVLGGLIASRRPGNPYGWLWLGLGLGLACSQVAEPYAAYALVVEPGSLPAPLAVNTVLASGWALMVVLLPFVFLLFPTGRLPSRRWRPLAWVVLAGGAVMLPLGFLSADSGQGPVRAPFSVGGAVGQLVNVVVLVAVLTVFASVILSALSLVARYRRASGVERHQLKWLALAAASLAAMIIPDLLGVDRLLGDVLWNLLFVLDFAALYVGVGIAILRHRLYDIDVIINRTLVYGSLTATLVALYFGGIVVLQRAFVLLTGGQSTLSVVASTLAIAALFNPLRRGIQYFIDRRFYRRKYDARQTLETFSATLSHEANLEALNNKMVGIVRETMQPAHVGLWLRPSGVDRHGEPPG